MAVDMRAKFPKMTPVNSAPTLFRLNGCGVGMYGKRDVDKETGTYVATWCLSILFVPLLGFRAYRVARAQGRGWYFLGTEPLSPLVKGWNVLVAAVVIAGAGIGWYVNYTGSPAYLAKQEMQKAAVLVGQNHPGEAAKIFATWFGPGSTMPMERNFKIEQDR